MDTITTEVETEADVEEDVAVDEVVAVDIIITNKISQRKNPFWI